MVFERGGIPFGLPTFEQPILHSGVPGSCQYCWKPIQSGKHSSHDFTGLEMPRPPRHAWHAKRPFPTSVLFRTERRSCCVGPCERVGAVVSRENNERIVC